MIGLDHTPTNDIIVTFKFLSMSAAYAALTLGRAAANVVLKREDERLRVLLYHDVPMSERDRFAGQLRWLARRWSFISPEQFEAILEGRERVSGRQLLLTFDDGLVSNFEVAIEVLRPMRIHAIFFVISDLMSLSGRSEVRAFLGRHLFRGESSPPVPDSWSAMSWVQLAQLLEAGHTIGAHTRSHQCLSGVANTSDLIDQVVTSADEIESKMGVPIKHFAYPFGDIASFSAEAMTVARRRFRFIHSGIRGINGPLTSPHAIRRDALAVQDGQLNYAPLPNSVAGGFLEGCADWYYRSARRKIDCWAQRE